LNKPYYLNLKHQRTNPRFANLIETLRKEVLQILEINPEPKIDFLDE
jgi:hypothetical protein